MRAAANMIVPLGRGLRCRTNKKLPMVPINLHSGIRDNCYGVCHHVTMGKNVTLSPSNTYKRLDRSIGLIQIRHGCIAPTWRASPIFRRQGPIELAYKYEDHMIMITCIMPNGAPSQQSTMPTESILATVLSTSESVLSGMPPRITITLDELARALDQMGSTEPVLATRLYHTLLQLQSVPPTAEGPTTIQSESNHDVYDKKQYTMNSSAATNNPDDQGSYSI
jgi:hypothetical protein